MNILIILEFFGVDIVKGTKGKKPGMFSWAYIRYFIKLYFLGYQKN